MPLPEQVTNGLSFNLSSTVTANAATLTPPSYVGWPTTGQTRITIESEIILLDLTQQPWPITRGIEGTTPASHASGVIARQQLTAGALTNLRAVAFGPLMDPNRDDLLTDPDLFPVYDPFTKFPVVDPFQDTAGFWPEPILDPDGTWIAATE